MAGNWHPVSSVKGADGVGVPRGGARGQVLKKVGGSDFATAWDSLNYEEIEGTVPQSALPPIGMDVYPVDSEAAMLNLPANPGNLAVRTDAGKTFILHSLPASTLSNWLELQTSSDVTSVNGRVGDVTITKADVGLSNVTNTADADKPLATQSVRGLMAPADKAKLDKATANNNATTVVMRSGTGRSTFTQLEITNAPTTPGSVITKQVHDDAFASRDGGQVVSTGQSIQKVPTATRKYVIEGFPTGAPVLKPSPFIVLSDWGWVRDAAWLVEEELLGLGYAHQVASLLKCEPAYMIGFKWERFWNPATGAWGAWNCIGGDTGWITAQVGGTRTFDTTFYVRGSQYVYSGWSIQVRRTAGDCYLTGAFTVPNPMPGGVGTITSSGGATLGWFGSDDLQWPTAGIWAPQTEADDWSSHSIQQGTSTARWLARLGMGRSGGNFSVSRYDAEPTNNTWLPTSMHWKAPRLLPQSSFSSSGG